MTRRRAPADLDAAGRALHRAIGRWLAGQELALDPHEAVLVEELARSADRLATLRDAIGTLDVLAPAWTRLASEERQQRLAFGRLVSAIGFPTGIVPEPENDIRGLSPRSRRAQKAARARWSQGQRDAA